MPNLHHGDCLEVMRQMEPDSVDAIVTDPPYHLVSIVKRFGKPGSAPAQFGKDGAYRRHSTGFMGKEWDGGDIAQQPEVWAEALRVAKPGAHLLAFGGTRTYHRLVCAIEDAGWEIRDTIAWVYGQGFPKSHDVSKAIDKAAGAEREVVGTKKWKPGPTYERSGQAAQGYRPAGAPYPSELIGKVYSAPATAGAKQWDGWGTALKPAMEPIVVARKPLIGTVAQNVLEHGTGALNIDECRVGDNRRWPANLIHDGSDEVLGLFPNGSARFCYCAKASRAERNAGMPEGETNKHPTVKPIALMRYLCRLVTPPNGIILDPFMGSGSTGVAAKQEGFRFIGIEKDEGYIEIAKRRIAYVELPLFDRETE